MGPGQDMTGTTAVAVPMLHVLFVDDQRQVLEGLRQMLLPPPEGWEVGFCTSGQQALDIMAKSPVDVLVADLRMPGMTGSALLEAVRELYPQVVRVAFAERGDREALMRAIGAVQQHIVKPTDADTLRTTLARAQALHTLMASPQLRGVVGELGALPAQGEHTAGSSTRYGPRSPASAGSGKP